MAHIATAADQPQLPDCMFSLADLVDLLRVSRRTLQTWRANGVLPPPDLKRGRVLRWRAATIDMWLNNQPEQWGAA